MSEYIERFNAFYREKNRRKPWGEEKYLEVPLIENPWTRVVLRTSFGPESARKDDAKIWRSIAIQAYVPKLKTPKPEDLLTPHEWRDVIRVCLSPSDNASLTIEVVAVYDQDHKSVETVTVAYDISEAPRMIGFTSVSRDDRDYLIAHKNRLIDYGFYNFSSLPGELNFPATFDNIFSSINTGDSNIPDLIPNNESSSKTLPTYWYLQ